MDNSVLIKKVYNKSLVFSMLMIIPASLASIIDTIFIGMLVGPVGTAAYGLVMPTTLIINALSLMLGNGGITLYLDHVGKGEKGQADSNFTMIFLVSLVVSVALAALGFFGADAIIAGLGAKGDKAYLLPDGAAYMRGIMLSVVPTMICGSVDRYVRMDGGDKLVLAGTLGMGISNAALDYVLGSSMGMWGIGLATFCCYLVYLAILCLHLLQKENHLRFVRPMGWARELGRATRSGSASAAMRICQAAGMIITNVIILGYGAENLAGATIRNSVAALFIFLSMGLEMATMLLAGMFYGERDEGELVKLLKKSVSTELVMMVILAAAVYVFARPFASIFTHDEQVLEVSVVALRWYAVFLPTGVLAETLQYVYQGVHNNLMANFICVMSDLVLFVPAALIMTGAMGVLGYWVAPLVANLTLLVIVFLIVSIHGRKIPRTAGDWLMLRPDFASGLKAVWSFSIGDNSQDVVRISQALQDFCRENGVDERRSYKIALAAEEMADNIVEHAFKTSGGNYIDMCAQIKDDGDVTLRIRDNGRGFNPIAYVGELSDDGDISSNIGIKMTQKIVKDMDYRYIGGLNNLLLTI